MTKLIFTFAFATFAFLSCKSQISKDPIDKFWKWFETNQKRLRGFETNPDKVLTEVSDSAKKIERGLAIEFEPPKNNVVNVTISADGNKSLFPIVKEIVEKAPKINGWSFVAFRQRFPKDKVKSMALRIEGNVLDPGKMKFFPIIKGDSLNVIVFANNITEKNYDQIAYGGLMLIDNILGEYDCVTKVHSFDFQNMPTKPEDLKELIPLLDLADYVDKFFKSKHK